MIFELIYIKQLFAEESKISITISSILNRAMKNHEFFKQKLIN